MNIYGLPAIKILWEKKNGVKSRAFYKYGIRKNHISYYLNSFSHKNKFI